MSTQGTLDAIAYVAWHGIRVLDEAPGRVRLSLPAREDLLNFVGSGHAGALFTLAETAAGVAADSVARTLDAFILLKGATVRYTRRASGELAATGEASAQAVEAAKNSFAGTRRADLAVRVVIHDPAGEAVFEGMFDYALRPKKP